MMIGPEPMTRTDFRSARLPITLPPAAVGSSGRLHERAELAEQAGGVMRAGRGLGVVLDGEGGAVGQPQALDDTVVEVDVGDLGGAERGVELDGAGPVAAGRAGRQGHREAVAVAGGLSAAGAPASGPLGPAAAASTS